MLTSPGVASPIRRTFDAMGTRIHVIAAPDSDVEMVNRAASTVERIFGSQEARFSRFRPDSELSRINADAGRWTQISRPFSEVTRLALTAAEHTGGLFDPTVLRALRAAGYERTFTEVLERTKTAPHEDGDIPSIRREARTLLIKGSISCGAWRTIELEDDRILMPRGAELDFGGIAKGCRGPSSMQVAT